MKQIKKGHYGLIAYGKYLELTQISPDIVDLSCSEDDFYEIWEDYFDLKYDYNKIVEQLSGGDDKFLKEAVAYGSGIRILKQEPFEAMISFIISQNKNIPAIKNCIEGICNQYGEKRICVECNHLSYVTFPSAEVLAKADKDILRSLKTGYRDEYILQASKAVAEGELNLEMLKTFSCQDAVNTLKKIHGIGEKVANCISLYGLHHIEGFPVDVWILRVLKEVYHDKFSIDPYKGYAGIVQQYMFYYMRYLKGVA
jgi:N-glycosylase/DNA lyase